jgi:2-polyprenyl-3-methyl-5-hydroxy-6-metoxy-1,4-benzoquinol methylase
LTDNRQEEATPPLVQWTPEMVARFWDFELSRPWNFFAYQAGSALIARVRKYLPANARIVDYGAGAGFLMEDLLAAGYRCGGVEHGEGAVAALKKKFQGKANVIGLWHVREVVGLEARFDAAFLTEVVEHLYDAELETCLAQIDRLLVPGGRLVVTTPNEENLADNMIMSPETGRLFHRWQHVRSWSATTLRQYLEDRGFLAVAVATTNLLTSPRLGHRQRPAWQRWGIATAALAATTVVPTLRKANLIVIVEKPGGA